MCSVMNKWDFISSQFCSPLLVSEVVFVKTPSRQHKRRTKRREKYLQNRDDELESTRVQYNADPEQKLASAHDGN